MSGRNPTLGKECQLPEKEDNKEGNNEEKVDRASKEDLKVYPQITRRS